MGRWCKLSLLRNNRPFTMSLKQYGTKRVDTFSGQSFRKKMRYKGCQKKAWLSLIMIANMLDPKSDKGCKLF